MFLFSDGTNVLAHELDDGRIALLLSADHTPTFATMDDACAAARRHRLLFVDPVRYEVRTIDHERRGGYVRSGARVTL